MGRPKATPKHHSVYVIELDKKVLAIDGFKRANPEYEAGKPCVYVGMTGISPEERFEQHRRGYKASKYVRKHGLRLRPDLYVRHNPMTYDEASAMEIEKARRLRKRGYAVWQA